MKKLGKANLLASVSILTLVFGMGSAHAFNEVNWTWEADVTETVTKDIVINVEFDPTGMVMLEDLQVSIGDVSAESYVYNVANHQAQGANNGGTVEINLGAIDWTHSRTLDPILQGGTNNAGFEYTFDPMQGGVVGYNPIASSASNQVIGLAFSESGQIELGTITVEFQPSGEDAPLDALTELPEIVSEATAVANNTSIESDTMIELHEGQFAFGDGGVDGVADAIGVVAAAGLGVVLANEGVNSNLVGAAVLGTAAMLGAIEPAEVSAVSGVGNIVNASVDSSATAVVNNLSANIEAPDGDRVFIGDVTQFAFADVSAVSSVAGIAVNNYTSLGALDRSLVSSVATAVGNNKSITVRGPVLD